MTDDNVKNVLSGQGLPASNPDLNDDDSSAKGLNLKKKSANNPVDYIPELEREPSDPE